MVHVDIPCPKDSYLDPDIGDCQPCHKLCHQAEVRGNEAKCQQYCPVSSSTALQEFHRSVTTGSPIPTGEGDINGVELDSAIITVVIVFSSIVIIAALYGLYVLVLKQYNCLCVGKAKASEMICLSLCMAIAVRKVGIVLIQHQHYAHYQKRNWNADQEIVGQDSV